MNTSARIRLRPKKLSDAVDDYSWQSDRELSELDAALPLRMTYQQYLSEYTFDLCYPTSGRHEYAIETLDGEHIGNCVFYNVKASERKAEIGIMIGNRNYWNQGYGTETVNALLDLIFEKTSLEKIHLTTLNWNVRAQKCFKKCGFSECGRVSRDGYNFLLMVIHRNEREQLQEQNANRAGIESSVPQP